MGIMDPLIKSFLLYEITPFTWRMEIISPLEESYMFAPPDLAPLSFLGAPSTDTNYDAKGPFAYYGNLPYVVDTRILRAPQLLNSTR